MKRTLTSRGLAVVFTCLALSALAAAPASASIRSSQGRPRLVVVTGSWSDPGPAISNITPDGDTFLAQLDGSTTTVGDFSGTSAYTFQVVFDPAANTTVGTGHETFTAQLRGVGSGHLSFAERLSVAADGSEIVTGVIVGGDGAFAGAHGFTEFTGTTNDPSQSTPGNGSFWLVIDLAR